VNSSFALRGCNGCLVCFMQHLLHINMLNLMFEIGISLKGHNIVAVNEFGAVAIINND